jgi:hypothetical protein
LDGKFAESGDEPVDAAEILAALAKDVGCGAEQRRTAVSRYLSGGDGWKEASEVLGGTFASKDAG